ncbi:terpenoid synthase [Jackrogersella minutella]|nr:terpenoid synthase [Jackrogersella minutella]
MFECEGVAVLRGLEGQLLQVPDLRPIYANWTSGLNPHCDELRVFVDENIDRYVTNEEVKTKTKAIDLGWFTSLSYPSAEIEQLETMALISLVFFIFDDTIDKEIDHETPDFASDFDAATKLRQAAIAYMRYQFFQGRNGFMSNGQPPRVPQEFATFEAFASRVITAAPGQIDLSRLADDIQEFIEATALEQTHRLSGSLPSTEDYWTYRHGVGAVFPYCTLHQYVNNIRLPDDLAWCDEVRVMRIEASFQPLLCNDLYSLKKEIKENTPTNLVPIMIAESGRSLDSIVHELVEKMYSSAGKFDTAAASLRAKGCRYDDTVRESINMFIKAFESFQTGCFKFFMNSRRFGVREYEQEDGSYIIPL